MCKSREYRFSEGGFERAGKGDKVMKAATKAEPRKPTKFIRSGERRVILRDGETPFGAIYSQHITTRAVNRPPGRQFNRGLQSRPVPGEVFRRLGRPVRRVKSPDTLQVPIGT